jgi:hypothetical protein
VVPFFLPPTVTSVFLFIDCVPPNAAVFDFAGIAFNPPNVSLPIVGLAPGTCTVTVTGTDSGVPFDQSLTLTVH